MNLTDLPAPALVALAVLVVVQVGAEVVALVVLARTPPERVQLGRRWPWVLIILGVNLVGAVVFLAAGRRPPTVDGGQDPGPSNAKAVADELYGSQE
jgi:hypothetical protein